MIEIAESLRSVADGCLGLKNMLWIEVVVDERGASMSKIDNSSYESDLSSSPESTVSREVWRFICMLEFDAI